MNMQSFLTQSFKFDSEVFELIDQLGLAPKTEYAIAGYRHQDLGFVYVKPVHALESEDVEAVQIPTFCLPQSHYLHVDLDECFYQLENRDEILENIRIQEEEAASADKFELPIDLIPEPQRHLASDDTQYYIVPGFDADELFGDALISSEDGEITFEIEYWQLPTNHPRYVAPVEITEKVESTVTLPSNPVAFTHRSVFCEWLATLAPKEGDRTIWFKYGHNRFFVGEWNKEGNFALYSTKKQNKDSDSRIRDEKVSDDAYSYLRALSEQKIEQDEKTNRFVQSGGIFYIPTQPIDNPLERYVKSTDDLPCEIDDLSLEDQTALYNRFSKVTGLKYASRLTSGGKSQHVHIKLDKHHNLETANYLRRLFLIVMMGDPAVANLHQPMRVPGFYRYDKGNEQALINTSPDRYTPAQVIEGLRLFYADRGFVFPNEIPDNWWYKKLKPILALKKKNVPHQEKVNRLQKALSDGYDGFLAERKATVDRLTAALPKKSSEFNLSTHGTNFLDPVLAEIFSLDALSLFHWEGHNFVETDHYRGCCPGHESESGTAFYVKRSSDGKTWVGTCPECVEGGELLNAIRYHYALISNDLNVEQPTGIAFVEVVKSLCIQLGISMPVWEASVGTTEEVREVFTPKNSYARQSELSSELEDLDGSESLLSLANNQKIIDDTWEKVAPGLPNDVVDMFSGLAKTSGFAEIVHLLSVLGVISSEVTATHFVSVPRVDQPWNECLNTFTAIVGEPGSSKSETVDAAVQSVAEKQDKYTQLWKDAKKEYDSMTKEEIEERKKNGDMPEEPIIRICSFNGGTMEALIASMCNAYEYHRSGILWHSDELTTIFDGLNKHNKGNDDLKRLLEMFNGKHASKNTSGGGLVSTPKTAISVIGGIPEDEWVAYCKKLSNMSKGEGTGNGFSGRFLTGYIPRGQKRSIKFGAPKHTGKHSITSFVEDFASHFTHVVGDQYIEIAPNAIDYCQYIQDWTNNGRTTTNMANHYAKGCSYTYRLAGLLALIAKPSHPLISLQHLKSANAIVEYSIAVNRQLLQTSDTSSALGVVTKAYEIGQRKGKLDANELSNAKLGTAKERQDIIKKVYEMYGGKLTPNARNKLVWIP
jgi:hypothetical protein